MRCGDGSVAGGPAIPSRARALGGCRPADRDRARGQIVGAIERVARKGEWRTKTALGGTRRLVDPPGQACALALAAARAIEGDLVGVDLLPPETDSYSVIELNGAVDFVDEYGLGGGDAYVDAITALGLADVRASAARSPRSGLTRPESSGEPSRCRAAP